MVEGSGFPEFCRTFPDDDSAGPTILKGDNRTTTEQLRENRITERNRFYLTNYHFVREIYCHVLGCTCEWGEWCVCAPGGQRRVWACVCVCVRARVDACTCVGVCCGCHSDLGCLTEVGRHDGQSQQEQQGTVRS